MKKQEAHKNTLEFLDKFISNRGDVLKRIIQKHSNTIAGPTYGEYLISLDETYEVIEYLECQPSDGIDWSELTTFEPFEYSSPPPIIENKNKISKKDSAKLQSLSFFV
jgi:hypothetical protein